MFYFRLFFVIAVTMLVYPGCGCSGPSEEKLRVRAKEYMESVRLKDWEKAYSLVNPDTRINYSYDSFKKTWELAYADCRLDRFEILNGDFTGEYEASVGLKLFLTYNDGRTRTGEKRQPWIWKNGYWYRK